MQKKIVLIYLFSYISMLRCDKNLNETRVIKLYDYIFPFDFEFGAGTSAYQSDGAWNVHGKVESIWDKFVHRHPEKIIDNGTGDIACNSYNFCRKDIQLAKELGVNYYQFSISWTRLFIYNDTNTANQYGLLYYHDILDRLRAGGIKARVTMYYWDLPQKLEDRGGWTNPETIKHFVNYARLLFQNFGHKVKTWITFSRPFQICKFGYGLGIYAPGRSRSGIDDYRCAHNILKAHAENDYKQEIITGILTFNYKLVDEYMTTPDSAKDSLTSALNSNIIPNREYLLQGSVVDQYVEVLLHRLRGLCDNVDDGAETFYDHEMCFSLCMNSSGNPLVFPLRVRRALDAQDAPYQLRYIGQQELGDKNRPTIVRSSIDVACSASIVEFLQELGCRLDFEYTARGYMFRKGRMKITVSKICKCGGGNKPGENIELISQSYLVELSVLAPSGYDAIAEDMRVFAEQLKPLVHLEKIDYKRL
ncbi:glycosyl hydrolase [Holotrichia oblita]|uniref:Glycosyl hydrolase n=1 Tax=Holotrichia oblita TaxID=644536 RepID=A0ACB9SUH7_HOLOL|nr:glycosyl hydrolase [Holotrichia oblita]